jgi:hypothetical protein
MEHFSIDKVSTAIKVGNIKSCIHKSKKWIVEWNVSLGKQLTQNNGRVYFIVVNGNIYKIGGSQDSKGIKGTFHWYQNCAFTGGPSLRTHGIHVLIHDELEKGNVVEIYMIVSTKVIAEVTGLFGVEKKLVNIDFKEIENTCKEDYKMKCGRYPKWNFQENGEEWDIKLVESWNLVNNTMTKRRNEKK